jgi:hypothetical protein
MPQPISDTRPTATLDRVAAARSLEELLQCGLDLLRDAAAAKDPSPADRLYFGMVGEALKARASEFAKRLGLGEHGN